MFLARKISRAKWDTAEWAAGEIPADAVTIDLRTNNNTLSFWQCPTGTDSDVAMAALAIAAGSERLDKLDIVWVADEELQADGQILSNTDGRTPVMNMKAMHVDVSGLDYVRLGKVASRIVAAIEAGQYRRFRKACIEDLIKEAAVQGRIDRGALHEKMRAAVVG